MRILDAGTVSLSNADMLKWIREKRQQIQDEDTEDKAAGVKVRARPQNFLTALNKHERELDSRKYPYQRNPKVYEGYDGMKEFDKMVRYSSMSRVLRIRRTSRLHWRRRLRMRATRRVSARRSCS